MKMNQIRIMVADGDRSFCSRVSAYLKESGFETKAITDSYLLRKAILEWRPHFLFIDLLYPGFYAQECLQFLKMRSLLGPKGIHVVVMSNHTAEMNVRNCLEAGADDFLVKPFQMIDLLQRLSLLTQAKKYNFSALATQNQEKVKNYFEMISLIVKAATQNKEVPQLRFDLIQMISLALKAVRTSIIEFSDDYKLATVIGSSDDDSVDYIPLNLKKYPELEYVIRTRKPLFVESIEKDLTLAFVKHEVKSIQFDSMMVLPLNKGGRLVGCLSVRMPKGCKKLSILDIKMAEITSQVIAMTWKFSNAPRFKKAS
jgi:DNA-binding response OmpR family regulator